MIALPKPIPGEPKPVVVSYLRFSRPEQMRGDSLRRQTANTVEWSKRHGIPLDESLAFEDLGVSAYRGKNADQGALAMILSCIENGRIWRGCYLSIENLDRLSRQAAYDSVALMQRILAAGVRIVTHSPSERIYTEDSTAEIYTLLEMLLTFERAHEESSLKSERLSASWSKKREVIDKKKLTARSPAWLEPIRSEPGGAVVDFKPIKSRVAIIQRIYQLCIDGNGNSAICRTLNAEETPTFGKAERWPESTVGKLLNDRSVLGEYQPHKMVDGKRVPTGDAVEGYFPTVIDEATFYSAQSAIANRKLPRGKRTDRVTNLFAGLLVDARDGSSCDVIDKGAKSSGPAIVSSAARLGAKGSIYLSVPYEKFETAVLSLVTEIDLSQVMPKKANRVGKLIAAAVADVVAIEGRVSTIKAKIKKQKKIDALLDLLIESESELQDAKDHLESLRRQQATPASHALDTTKKLLAELNAGKRTKEIRTRIRATVRQFVKDIVVLPIQMNASDRVLIADIELTSGKRVKLAIETGAKAPAELYGLDVRDFASWPKQWKATKFEVITDTESKVIAMADKGYLIREIVKKMPGLTESSVSRILIKHGRRKTSRKSRDSSQLMTWHEAGHGWVKRHKKKRYFVGYGTLKEKYPRLVKSLDRGGTLKAANRWWTEKLSELADGRGWAK